MALDKVYRAAWSTNVCDTRCGYDRLTEAEAITDLESAEADAGTGYDSFMGTIETFYVGSYGTSIGVRYDDPMWGTADAYVQATAIVTADGVVT